MGVLWLLRSLWERPPEGMSAKTEMGSIDISVRRLIRLHLGSCLTGLPTEILEQTLLHRPGWDIVTEVVRLVVFNSMECLVEASRLFQDLARNSPKHRYWHDISCNPSDFT